jgi:hypothetical protein
MSDNHKTHLSQTYPSGAQEWECLECGRLVIWQGLPLKIKNIVLIEGNPNVYHSGEVEGINFDLDITSPKDQEVLNQWGDELKGLKGL